MALTLAGGGGSSHTLSAGNQGNKETLYFDGKPISQEIVNIIYPVGSVYMSLNNVNPSVMFGGSWQEITGRYIKLGGDGEQINNCKTSCHVTVSNDGQNPCPTNCNYYVSNSDTYQKRLCGDGYNWHTNEWYYNDVARKYMLDICTNCFNGCVSDVNYTLLSFSQATSDYSCEFVVIEETWGANDSRYHDYFTLNKGFSGANSVSKMECSNGCYGCVACHPNTVGLCNSCNSACYTCYSPCANCYSNCHGSVGQSFSVLFVHMWKRVG